MINAFKNTKARAGNLDLSMMFRNPKMQAEMPTSSPMPINDPKLGQIPDIGINGQPGMGAVADTPPIGIQRDLPPIMPIEPQKNPYTDLMQEVLRSAPGRSMPPQRSRWMDLMNWS